MSSNNFFKKKALKNKKPHQRGVQHILTYGLLVSWFTFSVGYFLFWYISNHRLYRDSVKIVKKVTAFLSNPRVLRYRPLLSGVKKFRKIKKRGVAFF